MNTAVTQEERDRVTRPAHPEAAPSSSRDDRNRTPRNVNNWIHKGKGKGKFKGKNDDDQAVNVNVGVDGTVSIIVGELDGCDLWSILVATSMQFLISFVATDYLRVTFTLTVRQCNFGGS